MWYDFEVVEELGFFLPLAFSVRFICSGIYNRRKVSHNKSAKPVLLATLEALITL